MNIQPITLSDEDKIAQAAALLIEGFPLNTEWNTRPRAMYLFTYPCRPHFAPVL